MLEITCATLERLGRWNTSKCCQECHWRNNPDLETEFLGPDGAVEFRVSICCRTDGTPAFTDEVLKELAEEEAASRRGSDRVGRCGPRLEAESTAPG